MKQHISLTDAYLNVLTESVKGDKSKTKYILEVRDPDKQILHLLETIKGYSTAGHTFPVVVDPNDSEYKEQFEIDGDGSCQLIGINVEENEE